MTLDRRSNRDGLRNGKRVCWLMLCLLWAPLPASTATPAEPSLATGTAFTFDPVHTRFGFELRTRWGQRVTGTFPRFDGELVQLPDGRQQVRIRLEAAAVEVAGSPRYAALARGPRFFHAQRYPLIEFVSEPYPGTLVETGGPLRGRLTMCGVSRMETFELAPSECVRSGRDCDAVAYGSVDRSDYALQDWRFVLADTVRFELRLRLQEPAQADS